MRRINIIFLYDISIIRHFTEVVEGLIVWLGLKYKKFLKLSNKLPLRIIIFWGYEWFSKELIEFAGAIIKSSFLFFWSSEV